MIIVAKQHYSGTFTARREEDRSMVRIKFLIPFLAALALALTEPVFAQDVLNVGSLTASPGATVDIPISIRDVAGTPLGIDAGAGSRIQGISVTISYSPASAVVSATIVRSGITASLTPLYETTGATPGTISYLGSFIESTNPLPFTQPPAGDGNEVLRLRLTFDAAAAGTVTLTPLPANTMLSNQAGTTGESNDNGAIALGSGSVTLTASTPTTVLVTSSINPAVLGQSVIFTATVQPTSGSGTPTGTIQFKADGVSLGPPVTLAGGTANISTSSLALGTHTITAEYGGDANFSPNTGTLSPGETIQCAPFAPIAPFTVLKYAREVGFANAAYALPAGSINHAMHVAPIAGKNFFVDVSLDSGAMWTGNPGVMTISVGGCLPGAANFTLITPIGTGRTVLRYFAQVTASFQGIPTINYNYTGARLRDVENAVGNGGTINITLATFDAATGNPLDQHPSDTAAFLAGVYAVSVDPAVAASSAVIDVYSNALRFVGGSTSDSGATIGIRVDSSVYNLSGTAYALSNLSNVQLLISPATGTLAGIKDVIWDPAGVSIYQAAPTGGFTSPIGVAIGGGSSSLDAAPKHIQIDVDGSTILSPRTLAIQVNLNLGGGADGPASNSRVLLSATSLTVWTINGMTLVGLTNGNNAVYSGRFYLWNASSIGGSVTAAVYTLPTARIGDSTLLGNVNLGILPPMSGLNVRTAEDILAPLGIALPYTANGGNLAVVFQIGVPDCSGTFIIFNSTMSFGMVPMWKR